jgi:hypothetical protein
MVDLLEDVLEKKLAVIRKQDYVTSYIMLLYVTLSYFIKCQDNIAGVGTCYRLDNLGFEAWWGKCL